MRKTLSSISRLVAAGLAIIMTSDVAQSKPGMDVGTDRVRGELVTPVNPSHRAIYERLQQGRVLERLTEFFAPFRLPREVVMKVAGCGGVDNASYGDGVITVCYEYLENVLKNADEAPAAGEPTRRDAIAGATLDVFLHEMGHAVIDLLKIPIFGREEDAADEFSTYLLLHLGRDDARALILGVAYLGRRETREAMSRNLQLKHYADEHGLPGQRYFNLLCTAYGFDQQLFADAVSRWNLPAERAEGCGEEYAQLHHAFQALIGPNIDQERMKQVQGTNLLRFDIQ